MWGLRPGNCTYDKVKTNFEQFRSLLTRAITSDEKSKHSARIEDRVATAELYKEARNLFKTADNFNIMDIPEDKRSEIRELRDKMKHFDKNAQERICAICDQIDPKARNNQPSTSCNRRGPSPAQRYTERKAANIDENATPEKRNLCSRGTRCGASSLNEPNIHRKPSGQKNSKVAPFRNIHYNSTEISDKLKPPNRITTSRQPMAVNRINLLKNVDKKIGERLLDEVLDNTGVRMDDVAGCHGAKRALEEAVILPSLNPGLFSGLRQPVKGILLFGPPGNGKTLLAKAVAGDANQMFFNISASSLTSKWVGDSEKTIRGLFQIARNAQPSIIFIDEIDSILCERSEKDAEVSRRMKTEFLVQFDGATTSPDDRILVIGATNRPYELDDAVLRRFPKRILVGLPDERARYELISKTLLRHNMMDGLSDRDIRYIASNTKHYSNSDLVALCKEAAMGPVRSIDKSRLATTDHNKIRPVRAADFDEALRSIRPSTSQKIMQKLVEFSDNFGG